MKIVIASSHPYKPQIAGGTQSNTHEMALALLGRGHEVAVVSGLTGVGYIGVRNRVMMKLIGRRCSIDRIMGYPVFRSWFPWDNIQYTVNKFRPDVAIVQSGGILKIAKAFKELQIPIVLYNHNVEFDQHDGAMSEFHSESFIANSEFTAKAYREAFGIISEVIVPLFDKSSYVVKSSRRNVLFINPHKQKGVETAIALAQSCTDIPFSFVKGWTLTKDEDTKLKYEVSRAKNIKLHPKTDIIKDHYRDARIVIVPSVWAETWGRVATEAQFSGIPVIASNKGGLSEAVGPGGILLDPKAPITVWKDAVRSLWDDPVLYEKYSAAADVFSQRSEINPVKQLDHLEVLLKSAICNSQVGQKSD